MHLWKSISGFIGPKILNFSACPRGPRAVLFRLASFLLEALGVLVLPQVTGTILESHLCRTNMNITNTRWMHGKHCGWMTTFNLTFINVISSLIDYLLPYSFNSCKNRNKFYAIYLFLKKKNWPLLI